MGSELFICENKLDFGMFSRQGGQREVEGKTWVQGMQESLCALPLYLPSLPPLPLVLITYLPSL